MFIDSRFAIFVAGMSVGALGMFGITRMMKKRIPTSGQVQQQVYHALSAELKLPIVSEHKQNQVLHEQKALPIVIEQKISPPSAQHNVVYTPSSILNLAICPITGEIIQNAAMTSCGQTYERSAIQAWLDGGHRTDPKTRQDITTTLKINYLAQDLIEGIVGLSPDPHKTQEEIQAEQHAVALLVEPLQNYAYATGIQKLKSTHQADARKNLIELRSRLHVLNRCDEADLQDKVEGIVHWISEQKPSKNNGEYCNSLEKVKKNIINHYASPTHKHAVLGSRR